jgi:hypothetical protein
MLLPKCGYDVTTMLPIAMLSSPSALVLADSGETFEKVAARRCGDESDDLRAFEKRGGGEHR